MAYLRQCRLSHQLFRATVTERLVRGVVPSGAAAAVAADAATAGGNGILAGLIQRESTRAFSVAVALGSGTAFRAGHLNDA